MDEISKLEFAIIAIELSILIVMFTGYGLLRWYQNYQQRKQFAELDALLKSTQREPVIIPWPEGRGLKPQSQS